MDIAVGEQEDFVGDFKEGVVVVVGEDDAFGGLLAADEVLYPFTATGARKENGSSRMQNGAGEHSTSHIPAMRTSPEDSSRT